MAWDDAAEAALAALFRHFGTTVSYTPDGGAAVEVSLAARGPREVAGAASAGLARDLGGRVEQYLATFEMRVSEASDQGITRPVKDDVVTIASGRFAGSYRVRTVATDDDRRVWILGLAPQAGG